MAAPPPGTVCYRVAVLHLDNVNQIFNAEFAIGVTLVDGSFMETTRTSVSVPATTFYAAFGPDGTTFQNSLIQLLTDAPSLVAPYAAAVASIPYYGS